MKVRLERCTPTETHGGTLWVRIGKRLQTRRTELGLKVNDVARELGIAPRAYTALEDGIERASASLLGQIAALFRVGVYWFFQDVEFGDGIAGEAVAPHAAYRVATLEERVEFLADSFRKLDLEGQQHLLALANALSRTGGKGET
jgi:transcriptional regulator with XRE-family HTH domain